MKRLFSGLVIILGVACIMALAMFFLVTEPRKSSMAEADGVLLCEANAGGSVVSFAVPPISKQYQSTGHLLNRHVEWLANDSQLAAYLDVAVNSVGSARLLNVAAARFPKPLYEFINIELFGRSLTPAVKTYLFDKFLFNSSEAGHGLLRAVGAGEAFYSGRNLCLTLSKSQDQAFADTAKWLIEKDVPTASIAFYASKIAEIKDAGELELLVRRLLVFADIRAKAGSTFEQESTALISALAAVALKTYLHNARKPELDYLRDYKVIKELQLEGRSDFAFHFIFSALVSAKISPRFAGLVGELREFSDAYQGSGFSFKDLTVNYAGITFTERLLRCNEKNSGIGVATVLDKGFLPILTEFEEFLRVYGEQKISPDQLLNQYLQSRGKLIKAVEVFYQVDHFCR